VLFAMTTSILTGLIFGLIPALRANRSSIEETLRSRARSVTGGARKVLSGFVICQIALALVLLSSAAVLGRTLLRLSALNPGIDTHNLLTARAAWPELVESMRRVPAIQSVALTDIVPMREGENVLGYWASAIPPPPNQESEALSSGVTPDYLKVMRLPLLRGRFIDENDRLGNSPVVVIDEKMAKRAFPGQDPIGKRLWIPALSPTSVPVQVVGVVGHVRHWGLADDDLSTVQDQCYYPLAQVPDRLVRFFSSVMSVVIRTDIAPVNTIEALQQQARGATGDQALYEVRTMEQLVSASLARQRFLLLLFAIFAGIALLLACVGIYSVIAYLMGQRVSEIGVRVALGATSANIVAMVLRQSLVMIFAGIGIGVVTSFASGRVLQRLVPEVQTSQASMFIVVLPLLIAVALAASYIPARRASKVDPMVALRYE
jgi:predicted permease